MRFPLLSALLVRLDLLRFRDLVLFVPSLLVV